MYLPFWKVFFFSVWYYITYGENLLMIRLETHCHTRYSKDSLLLHSLLYIKCRLCHIDAIAICEHNNILGALKFKEYCSKRNNKVFVIVGEEIMASSGEIIGLYLNEEMPQSVFCHLLQHLQENDNNILGLLSCESSEVFLRYFKDSLNELVQTQFVNHNRKQNQDLPQEFLVNHISGSFVEMVLWWLKDKKNIHQKN